MMQKLAKEPTHQIPNNIFVDYTNYSVYFRCEIVIHSSDLNLMAQVNNSISFVDFAY